MSDNDIVFSTDGSPTYFVGSKKFQLKMMSFIESIKKEEFEKGRESVIKTIVSSIEKIADGL